MARLKDKVQNALDEARLLVLGAQVLLGFEYRSVFESGFDVLPSHSKYLKLVGLGLLLVAFALLTWPGAYHRIVAGGEDTEGVHQFTSRVMEIALAPFLIALGFDMFVAAEKVAGATAGVAIGVLASLMAFVCWYGLEVVRRGKHRRIESEAMETEVNKSGRGGTRLSDKIRHVLTETRVVLPGAQALLGFQLVTILIELAFAAALLMLALSYGLWFGLTCYWRRPNERLGLRTNENDSRHPAIDQAIHN